MLSFWWISAIFIEKSRKNAKNREIWSCDFVTSPDDVITSDWRQIFRKCLSTQFVLSVQILDDLQQNWRCVDDFSIYRFWAKIVYPPLIQVCMQNNGQAKSPNLKFFRCLDKFYGFSENFKPKEPFFVKLRSKNLRGGPNPPPPQVE